MFSFLIYCETHTYPCRPWFYLRADLVNGLCEDERALIAIRLNEAGDFYQCFYPPETISQVDEAKPALELVESVGLKKLSLEKQMKRAIKLWDFDEIEKIKQQMKELK